MQRRSSKPGDPIETGLRLLGRRDHSREELRRKLSRRGHEKQAIEEALQRIHKAYCLDDEAFARSYVRRRASSRGPLAIASELAARGIARQTIEAALAAFEPADQVGAATRLAERLYEPEMSYRELLDRVGSKLLRRGFSTSVVLAACRSVLETARLPED